MKEKLLFITKRIVAIVLALVLWHVLAVNIHQKILLVTPLAVIQRLTTIWKLTDFWTYIWFTFYHIAGGFLLGLIFGIVLAVLSYKVPLFETLLWPYMETVKAVPVASFVVICLIWLTSDNLSTFISFLIVVPVIYQNVLTGLRQDNKKLEQMAKLFRLSFFRKMKYIIIPKVRPFLISACEVTLGMAWKAGVAAEIIGTPGGSIGKQIFISKMYLDTDDLLAWTVIIVLISIISEKIFMKMLKMILSFAGRYDE